MKFQPFAILCFALVTGILFGNYFEVNFGLLIGYIIALCVLLTILFWLKRFNKWYTVIGLAIVCLIGIIRYNQVNDVSIVKDNSQNAVVTKFIVTDIYKPSAKYNKYKVKAIKSEDTTAVGNNLLLYIKKSQTRLHIYDRSIAFTKIQVIDGPKNPHQFNYKNYINRKGIYYQTFVDTIYQIQHPSSLSYFHEISKFKQNIKEGLKQNGYSTSSQIFISSLGLGDRTDFNQDIQNTLSSVGILHLFAISGLHVGIIFGLVLLILYPLLFIRHGREFRIICALLFIWLYASFVYFTPSVTRAAFMISLYYLTFLLKRPKNLFHTLFFTAFALLLINPNQLYDVGFQLSYCAVFFIAWLYRPIRNLLPKYRTTLQNYGFDIISITISAQIGVLPISIFYFHQFTGLFIIGNLLLIPLAAFMVCLSVLNAILIYMMMDNTITIAITNTIFNFIFYVVEYIASFDQFIFDRLSITSIQLILLIAVVLFLKPLLKKFNWKNLMPIFSLIILFQLTKLIDQSRINIKSELIIFNEYKGNVIGVRNGNEMVILHEVVDSVKTHRYLIQPYLLKENITSVDFYAIDEDVKRTYFLKKGNLMKFDNQSILLVDKPIDSLPYVDYVIASKGKVNSKIPIPEKIKRVIAVGSNYPIVIKRLKENSDKIVSTAQDGAFIIKASPSTE